MLTDLLKLPLEFMGARTELALTLLGGRTLGRTAPRCTGAKPVITLPGFMASDATLARLNRFLNQQGFTAQSWGQGRSRGLEGKDWSQTLDVIQARLQDKVKAMSDKASAAVALVGHSMGGIYARELAVRMQTDIDRVIMLGAPSFHPYRTDHHNRAIEALAYWTNRKLGAEFGGRKGLLHWDPDDPPLPCVAIHSPVDGFVDEASCHIPDYIVAQSGEHSPRENIRILSSHVGMSANPWVLLAVADRLLADRDHWQPFDPRHYFPRSLDRLVRLVYPEPLEPGKLRGAAAFREMRR